jgi:predicted dehydrogenase
MDALLDNLRFSFEHEHRLKAAFVGCGGQASRNLLPVFRFAPLDLIATCDIQEQRAAACARSYGALRYYTTLDELLTHEDLDVIFLATGYDHLGIPLYPGQASRVLEAGCHVWIEKPPAARVEEIEALHEKEESAGRYVGVGFMKMFSPGAAKLRELLLNPEFGVPTSLYLRDPEVLPPPAQWTESRKMKLLLDHIVHPSSLMHSLLGPIRRVFAESAPNGAAMVSVKFVQGACGVLHMPWGQSSLSPMERLEIVGEGSNAVLEDNIRLRYYRPSHRGLAPSPYGLGGNYIGPTNHAPICWELGGYSGQPYNMHMFYQGYALEILYFCDCLIRGEKPALGNLGDAWHVTRFYETLEFAREQPLTLSDSPGWTLNHHPMRRIFEPVSSVMR